MNSTVQQWSEGEVAIGGWATLAGARKALRSADQSIYNGAHLEIRVRPNAEWASIGIVKDEFVLTTVKETAS